MKLVHVVGVDIVELDWVESTIVGIANIVTSCEWNDDGLPVLSDELVGVSVPVSKRAEAAEHVAVDAAGVDDVGNPIQEGQGIGTILVKRNVFIVENGRIGL